MTTLRIKLALAASAAILVAGCGSPETSTPQADASATEKAAPLPADQVDDPTAVAPTEQAAPPAVEAKVAEAPAAKTIPVRGKGSIEEKCLKAVAKEANNQGVGVNRIEESEAAIEVYVNLDGAAAPWKCLAYRDGTIGEVSFTGSEGEL